MIAYCTMFPTAVHIEIDHFTLLDLFVGIGFVVLINYFNDIYIIRKRLFSFQVVVEPESMLLTLGFILKIYSIPCLL